MQVIYEALTTFVKLEYEHEYGAEKPQTIMRANRYSNQGS